MEQQYIISILWLTGFLISHWMLRVEHEASGEEFTNGQKVLVVILSILSLAMTLYLLIRAWAASVKAYWIKPVKKKKAE